MGFHLFDQSFKLAVREEKNLPWAFNLFGLFTNQFIKMPAG